ncbi:UNVERIFIED_CONTAM: hypothetical protein GTU68_006282 [Idotea baltica]|nr:hypothetical protein [Idotea baltica]
MMQQYDDAKAACGDALLFFRMGDFYELFHDDAKIAGKVLGLNITSRDKSNAVPMAGFPYHQLDSYLGKLIKQGYRAAVCDQVEDPKQAKGLVKREVQQIVSPGTITDEALLDPAISNYLASPEESNKIIGVSWADISTGRFSVTSVPLGQLADLLARLNPSEILLPDQWEDRSRFPDVMQTVRPDWCFGHNTAHALLLKQFKVASLDGFGIEEFGPQAVGAAGAILDYLNETQKAALGHFDHIQAFRQSTFVEIDSATWRSLEISQTIRTGDRNGSLFGVIDRCNTPMGSRLLGEWLTNPLTDIQQVNRRHDSVAELVGNQSLRNNLRDQLKQIYDLQRLVSRVATGRPTPRDLSSIAKTLTTIPLLKEKLTGCESQSLQRLQADLDPCADIRDELTKALVDPCPVNTRDGGYIAAGYEPRLDELRNLSKGGKDWIAKYQQEICKQTGIPSLKVGYNKVFGFYLEVTHAHRDKIPADFIRKQTLKNAERFITPELKEYEEKVVSADTEAEALELQLFDQLRELAPYKRARLKTADIISQTRRQPPGQLATDNVPLVHKLTENATTNHFV